MSHSFRLWTVFSLTLTLSITAAATAQETSGWSQFRGPNAEGKDLPGALPDSPFGLTVGWSRDLGAGYSHVSVVDGKAVTMFTSDAVDVVAAFDTTTGDELWRYELGEKYVGHDGSTDGPLSTPTIADGTVYVLGPFGQLAAISLSDGGEIWRRALDEESSTVPHYGYTSSPVVVGDQIVLATGGEGHAITSFDRRTGEPKWSSGDDSVTYQTPSLVELRGRQQLVAVTDQFLTGIAPENGEILWQLQHTEGNQPEASAHLTPIDSERFLVKYGRGASLYGVTEEGVEELWQTNAFAGGFALPVRVDDHLYGFTRNFLTCASLETGEIAWRSRPPGGLGLSLVDGVLAVFAPDGDLVLVDPSPDGYRELSRVTALDAGDHAAPSFSDGVFLVRNLEQLAAVQVDETATAKVATIDPVDRLKGEFGSWIETVESQPEAQRQAAVNARFAKIESTPLIESRQSAGNENGQLVHFVWRGEATDIGLSGDPIPQGQEVGMHHLGGTDLFFTSVELDPKAQYTYGYSVDFERPAADPSNPHTVDNGFATTSELRMPEWPVSSHLDAPTDDAPRGTLDSFQFRSEILDNAREIKIWRPADYGQDPEVRYPVLVVNHGDNLLRGGLMQNSLDNLVGERVAPLIAVFVPRVAGAEYGGESVDDYVRFLTEELIPHLDRHYLTDGEPRTIMGPGSAGVTAVYAALQQPAIFRQAATQSFYPIEPAQERLPEMITGAGEKPEQIYVVWSRHDYDLGAGRRADESSRELIGQLQAAGIEVTEQIADYSPGWGGWRGQHDEVLGALFPLEAGGESGE